MTIQALPTILLAGFFFGSTTVATRFGVSQIDPLSFIGLQSLVASLSYIGVYLVYRRWPVDRQLWRRAILIGAASAPIPLCMTISLEYLSSGIMSLFVTTGPAFTVVLAHFLLPDELLTRRKILGVVMALGGALMLALSGESGLADSGQTQPIGYILVIVAMIIASNVDIYTRKNLSHYNAFDVTSIRIFTGAIMVCPLAFLLVRLNVQEIDGPGWLAVVYAALSGSFGGMLVAFYNIKRFGASVAAMTGYIIPIVATLGGALLLDETITGKMLLGMVIIISGISILHQRRPSVARIPAA